MVSFCAEGRLLLMVAFCAVVQVICAFVTLCLTVYVALRDTKHLKKTDERLKTAEKLAQPSSIAAWLERDATGDARIVIRNDSNLPVYEVVATIVVTHGAGCCKGEDLESPYQYRKILDLIPPGLHSVSIDMGGFYGMHRHPLVDRVENVGVRTLTVDRQTQAAPVLESGIAT